LRFKRYKVVSLGLLFSLHTLCPFSLADCTQKQLVTSFGNFDSQSTQINRARPKRPIAEPGARYLRARIHADSLPTCNWFITIRDQDLIPVQTLGPSDFLDTSFSWTVRVTGPLMNVELHDCSSAVVPSFTVDRVIWMPQKIPLGEAAYYSLKVYATPDWKELYKESDIGNTHPERVIAGDSVGILISSTDKVAWSCSGFMLTDSLFITNWHCGSDKDPQDPHTTKADKADFWNAETLHNAILNISWDADGIDREFLVSGVEQADDVLDFAILRVRPVGAKSPVAVGILADWSPGRGTQLYTIHHPLGMQKTYSGSCNLKNASFVNWINPAKQTDFTHDCDTEIGSSGAPLFNQEGEIVGIHHLPYDFDATCRITSENKAVAMSEILKVLKPSLKNGLVIHEAP
jgi:hypothetical protein